MAKRYGAASAIVFLSLVLCALPAQAQWVRNGIVVCGADNEQYYPSVMADGTGGVIVGWIDYRNGMGADIYGNKIEAGGYVYGDGLPICTAPGDQTEARFISDGAGGVFITWLDSRSGDVQVYAQYVDNMGTIRWDADGIPICTAINSKSNVRIVPDGAGGAIIAWADYRRNEWDIYAQRITSDGDTLWAADGMPVDTSMNDQYELQAVSDGAGGAYLAWIDGRWGTNLLFAQRIDGDGNLLWGPDAVQVGADGTYQSFIQLVASVDGGICVSWGENRYGWDDVFAQKVGADGTILWQPDGVEVCAYSTNKYEPQLADDGAGGVIVAWYDDRDNDNWPIYAERVDAAGNDVWSPEGVIVFPRYGDSDPSIVADGHGGIIAALDMYDVDYNTTYIYAQRVDHDGNVLWGPAAAPVCIAPDGQYTPQLAMDDDGGAVIAWYGYHTESGYADIFAQRVGISGLWGAPEPEIVACADVPDDQGGWVRVRTRASSHDIAGETDTPIFGYNVWREISGGGGPLMLSTGASKVSAVERARLVSLLSDPATAKGVQVNAPQAASLGLPPGEWEAVGFWFATQDTMYNIAVPTKDDSTEAGTPWETYLVTAHSSKPGAFAASDPAQGYSIDNLAPGLTAGFVGNETASPAGLQLTWTPNPASDLWKYNVYRGTDEFFVPAPGNLLGSTTSTGLHDGTWVKAYDYFYKLVAVDRHGNTGPSALLRPEDVNVATLLQSFAAALKQSAIEISWTISEDRDAAAFRVLRAEAGGTFNELEAPRIARGGLSFTMSDATCEPGTTYRYRVNLVEGTESRTLFETEAISTPAMPLTLYQNHPNPFNPSTTIGFYLPVDSPVTLDVYDTSGRLVARLLNGAKLEKGTHSVEWRGLDAQGRAVSSGVYFYRLQSGKDVISKKMILLR
jgi:hypothetical protein